MSQAPTRLRVEHLDHTLGIDTRRPRLSWWLPEGSRSQSAYRIRTGDWDSGRIEDSESVLVEFGGPPMRSRQRIDCTVKVWTDAGESDWSERVTWEMGLLDPDDWVAEWIEPPEADDPGASGHRPPWLLRRSFVVDEPVVQARLYATAHGLYELFLNGIRVGDAELTPGCTAYARNLQVQTCDVTGLLKPGANVIGAILSDGWFRGQLGAFRHFNQFGDRLALLAQPELTSRNGRRVVVASNCEWSAGTGSMLGADLMQGVVVDFRRHRTGWSTREYGGDGAWSPVRAVIHDKSRLCSSPSPAVRRIEELPLRESAGTQHEAAGARLRPEHSRLGSHCGSRSRRNSTPSHLRRSFGRQRRCRDGQHRLENRRRRTVAARNGEDARGGRTDTGRRDRFRRRSNAELRTAT